MIDASISSRFQVKSFSEVNWRTPDNYLQLAEIGIYIPFADAFEYNGRAFLLIGEPGSGKTSNTSRFVGYNNRKSKRLSIDACHNKFDGSDNFAYQTDSGQYVDLRPIESGAECYKISAIFHLSNDGCEIEQGDLELALIRMFMHPIHGLDNEETYRGKVDQELLDTAVGAYGDIPVFTLPFAENTNRRYRILKDGIDSGVKS